MAEPVLTGSPSTNVYSEHIFKIRCTFGASSTVSYRSAQASIEKTTTTTFTVKLPTTYAEVTQLAQSWAKPAGAAPLALQLTTNNVAVDGTLVFTSVATNTAGTATAPVNGDVVYLTIGVSRDILNDRFVG